MASESEQHDGLHVWTDMFDIEVIDPDTREPVAEGESGILVMTPYWNNESTPFLRWETGDYVSWFSRGATTGKLAIYPMIRHGARTAGFFKVRGVNINHADFEDFMNRELDVTDFKVEIVETSGLDAMRVSLELRRGATAETTVGLYFAIRFARLSKSRRNSRCWNPAHWRKNSATRSSSRGLRTRGADGTSGPE